VNETTDYPGWLCASANQGLFRGAPLVLLFILFFRGPSHVRKEPEKKGFLPLPPRSALNPTPETPRRNQSHPLHAQSASILLPDTRHTGRHRSLTDSPSHQFAINITSPHSNTAPHRIASHHRFPPLFLPRPASSLHIVEKVGYAGPPTPPFWGIEEDSRETMHRQLSVPRYRQK
jgi:hypothetical protein